MMGADISQCWIVEHSLLDFLGGVDARGVSVRSQSEQHGQIIGRRPTISESLLFCHRFEGDSKEGRLIRHLSQIACEKLEWRAVSVFDSHHVSFFFPEAPVASHSNPYFSYLI